MSAPVFIAGVGAISAIGNNIAECLASLEKGKAGMADMDYLDSVTSQYTPCGGSKTGQ